VDRDTAGLQRGKTDMPIARGARADVIVLGTGGIGSAACARLAARGATVIGLDRFAIAHDRGSSHGQTRLIRRAYFEHPDYVPLLLEAYRLWHRLEEDVGRRLFDPCGLLLAGPASAEAVVGALHAARLHALPVECLAAAEAMRRFPQLTLDDDWVAVWEAQAGYLLVEDCVRAAAEVAIRHGATLLPGVTVRGWCVDGNGVVVDTDGGSFRADRLVITPGAWAADLLGLPGMRFEVLRKSLFWFRPRLAATADFAPGPFPCFAFDTPAGFHYGFPALDDRGVKIAEHTGGGTVADPLGVDRTFDSAEGARVSAVAARRLPGVSPQPASHAVCMYTMTPDAHFCLGLHPDVPQVAVAAGFSGHGFKFASVIGEILADLALEGTTSQPIGFLRPDRFAGEPR